MKSNQAFGYIFRPDAPLGLFSRISHSILAFLARFSIATAFWQSGQTKVQGFAIDLVSGEFSLGWPRVSDSVVALFREEYRLPLISPENAATMVAFAEHTFPILLLFGVARRISALVLLVMTMTIQLFVYPDAYPTHGTWTAVLMFFLVHGPGRLSLDTWTARRYP